MQGYRKTELAPSRQDKSDPISTTSSLIVMTIVLMVLNSKNVYAEGAYVGYQLGAISRGGFIAGYQFDPQNSLELHFGGGPNFLTYGASWKHYSAVNSRNYYLFGLTKVSFFNVTEETKIFGLNLGYGHEYGKDYLSSYSYPLEYGGGPGYDFENNKFYPNVFAGYGFKKLTNGR